MHTIKQYEHQIRQEKKARRRNNKKVLIFRKLYRRLASLTSTAERKQYWYRPELDIIQNWVEKHLEGLQQENTRRHKRIRTAEGLLKLRHLRTDFH